MSDEREEKLPMERYSLRDAQDQLKKLMDEAQDGKTVLILDESNRAVQLVPVESDVKPRKPRKAGSARGKIKMSPDFDAPLPDFDEYME